MILAELQDPFHVTVDAVGQPGARTFYLQAEDERHRITVIVEKQQVDALARVLTGLLAQVDDQPATDWDRSAMALREPLEASWRVGELRTGLQEGGQRIVLDIAELVPEDEEPDEFRIWLNTDQVRRLVAHAREAVSAGRPTCALCGRPEEAEGHTCPATNGHGRLSR